jgi:RHS repeat-associated protein
VTYAYDPNSPSCLKSIGGARIEFSGSGSKLAVRGQGSCTPTTTYNVYYFDPDAEEQSLAPLNGSTPVADPSQLLENLPCGSGNGNYWIRPVSSVTHHEMASSPVMTMDGTSCGAESNAIPAFIPGQPSMNLQYVHWDHLGSTRMLTDERGVPIAKSKYYPFGHEAEFTGGDDVRQKFTGHERDERVGLDYMMARSCRMALGRFMQPDPYRGSMRPALPQSWNRYAYVLNNPINAIDPDGYAEQLVKMGCGQNGAECMVAGTGAGSNEPTKQPDNSAQMAAARNWFFGGKAGGAKALNDAKESLRNDPTAAGGARTPARGEPDSTTRFPSGQVRVYGPDGRAVKDIDPPHPDHNPEPHAHDWDWSKEPPRQPERPLTPEEAQQVQKALIATGTVATAVIIYEVVKWGIAGATAVPSGGASLAVAAAFP